MFLFFFLFLAWQIHPLSFCDHVNEMWWKGNKQRHLFHYQGLLAGEISLITSGTNQVECIDISGLEKVLGVPTRWALGDMAVVLKYNFGTQQTTSY